MSRVTNSYIKVDKLVDAMVQNGQNLAPVHMHRALRSFSLDVIIAYCFAQDLQTLSAPKFAHPWTIGQEQFFPKILELVNFSWYFRYRRRWSAVKRAIVELLTERSFKATVSLFKTNLRLSSVSPRIDELLADPTKLENEKHDTIFHHLLAPQKGTQLAVPSRSSLIDEASALIGAGGDTVASTTAFGMYYLLSNQPILKRLVEELDGVWSTHAIVGLQQLEKLPYLVRWSLRATNALRREC